MFVALTGCMVTDDQTTLRRRFPMVDLFFKPSMVRDFLVGLPDNAAPDLGEYGVALALEGLLPAQAGGSHRLCADHLRLQHDLHLLHRAVPPGPRTQPPDPGDRARGRAA